MCTCRSYEVWLQLFLVRSGVEFCVCVVCVDNLRGVVWGMQNSRSMQISFGVGFLCICLLSEWRSKLKSMVLI